MLYNAQPDFVEYPEDSDIIDLGGPSGAQGNILQVQSQQAILTETSNNADSDYLPLLDRDSSPLEDSQVSMFPMDQISADRSAHIFQPVPLTWAQSPPQPDSDGEDEVYEDSDAEDALFRPPHCSPRDVSMDPDTDDDDLICSTSDAVNLETSRKAIYLIVTI